MMSYFLSRPEQIKVSLTNICNYRCVMCYNPRLNQERGYISSTLMHKIIKECSEAGIQRIALGATGEPLVHQNYLDFLQDARKRNLQVSTTSNCSFLTQEVADSVLEAGLTRLNISIYSTNPKEHKQYTGQNNFEEVEANIRYFLKKWYACGSETEVNMWFLKIPGVNNYEDYLAFWGSLANSVGLNLPMKEPINWSGRVQFTNLPGRVPKIWFERSQGRPAVCIRRQIKCEHVRSYLHILHDGDVVPCCNIPEVDGKKEILFGNMQLDTIMGIWDSSRYKSFKKNHSRRDIKVYSPCRICSEIEKINRFHFPPLCLKSTAKQVDGIRCLGE